MFEGRVMADLFQTFVRNFKLGDCRRHCNSGWGGRSREINVMFRNRWLIALTAIAVALVPVIADAHARAGGGFCAYRRADSEFDDTTRQRRAHRRD
jgi:hypothetical protein